MPMVRECLRPGTVVECPMTVDDSLLKDAGITFTADYLMKSAERFSELYDQTFREKFQEYLPQRNRAEERHAVYLGGGCGFSTKTEVYSLFGTRAGSEYAREIFRKTLPDRIFRSHGHERDRQYGISPHTIKITYYDGSCYEMGKCLLSIK